MSFSSQFYNICNDERQINNHKNICAIFSFPYVSSTRGWNFHNVSWNITQCKMEIWPQRSNETTCLDCTMSGITPTNGSDGASSDHHSDGSVLNHHCNYYLLLRCCIFVTEPFRREIGFDNEVTAAKRSVWQMKWINRLDRKCITTPGNTTGICHQRVSVSSTFCHHEDSALILTSTGGIYSERF